MGPSLERHEAFSRPFSRKVFKLPVAGVVQLRMSAGGFGVEILTALLIVRAL
jgi:hypothetical protein